MTDQSDPIVRRSEFVAFQEELIRKMSEVMKEQHILQIREVKAMLATVNASVLTHSRTSPLFLSSPPLADRTYIFQTPLIASSSRSPFTPTLLNLPNNPLSNPLHQSRPSHLFPVGEDSSDEECAPDFNAVRRPQSGLQHSNRLKADIPVFYGLTNNDAFVDWVSDVDYYFAFVPVDKNISAQLVALRLKGCAKVWWRQTQSTRANKRKDPILSWRKMKGLMYE
ncbi:hypothetical protein ZOSMA_784G00020 [Zostera marina]|uniref:Retrotransposon gag domain-containing protein n=1 Tax=Zostera marina TaxID=29655 RepID=A0A0K9NNJ5_ZOSMR|nr:hypothetical protein ZOSMA_784G00020 [Zostera marina]